MGRILGWVMVLEVVLEENLNPYLCCQRLLGIRACPHDADGAAHGVSGILADHGIDTGGETIKIQPFKPLYFDAAGMRLV